MSDRKYSVYIYASVRGVFKVEAANNEEAKDKAFVLWGATTLDEATRVDISDVEIVELKEGE